METQLKIKDEYLFNKVRELIFQQYKEYLDEEQMSAKIEEGLFTKEYESIIIYR